MKTVKEETVPAYKEIIKTLMRADSLLIGQREVLELMAKRAPLFNILHTLVTILEEQYEGVFCSILLVDGDKNTFKYGVSGENAHDFTDEESGVSILPPYAGPCCMASHLNEPVIVSNVEFDKRWQKLWRDWSLENNLKSCRSHPIVSSAGKVLGAFAMYHKELADPTLDKLYQLELATLIAGIAIERKLLEQEEVEHRENQQKLNDDLSHALNLRDEFLSIASHELKNPLSVMNLQNQMNKKKLLETKEISYETLLKLFESNEKQIKRLLHHVEAILDISALSPGRVVMNYSHFDLCLFIREIIERLNVQIEHSKCHVELNIPEHLNGSWDHYRLEQVFTNLIINSTKYAPKSTIKIFVEKENDEVHLIFSDNGIGIEPRYHATIFDRYERCARKKENNTGLGLGLYIVKEIITAHKGVIKIESAIGVGTSFIATIPIECQ